ncbi:MAG TPA: GLPGLI family protein [Hanamia sp.]|nr:GLPGLI family protein [Hanamia sp.]
MKINIFFLAIVAFSVTRLNAQTFISKAKIEYEVKSDIRKTTLAGDNSWTQMLKDQLPRFKTAYYTLTFADNKSLYQFDHWDLTAGKLPDFIKNGDDENQYFYNYDRGIYEMQKSIEGSNVNIKDSIPKLNWKVVNENRVIAGFNCRKAVAVLLDSVYVFAFYTEEITIPGGPCSFNGLPGTILGVTVPRLYTSWIATKVEVNGVDVKSIKSVQAKKDISISELKALIAERLKDWYSDDPTQNKEIQERKAIFTWQALL